MFFDDPIYCNVALFCVETVCVVSSQGLNEHRQFVYDEADTSGRHHHAVMLPYGEWLQGEISGNARAFVEMRRTQHIKR